MIEYALLTAKSTIEALLSNVLRWIESTVYIFGGYIPDFQPGWSFTDIFSNFWPLLIIAGLVLIVVLELRR